MPKVQIPTSLDLNLWLDLALASDQPIERLVALEEIAFQGLAEHFLSQLDKIAESDDSPLCREKAKTIRASYKGKKVDQRLERIELTPERTRSLLEVGEETLKRIVQLSMRRPSSPEILDAWRAALLDEKNEEVICVGLGLLAKFGTKSDSAIALAFVNHPSSRVVIAAIDLLHSQNLEQFKDRIVQFLTSDDLDVRLQAIRKLRTFDAAEAQVYLRSLLAARNPLIRQKALRELLLVPFEESEALYLAYLAAELIPLLLVLAGSAIAMNPSIDLPMKLYDIFYSARGVRAHILNLVNKQLLTAIKDSGILKEPIETYLTNLQKTLEQRKLQLTCRMAVNDISSEEREIRLEAVKRLTAGLSFPWVREALEKHAAVETDEEIKEFLLQILNPTAREFTVEALRESVKNEKFYMLDTKTQKRFLAVIADVETFKSLRATVNTLLQKDLDKSVLLSLLDKIANYGTSWDPKALFPYLKHKDPAIVAAALRAIGKLDIDSIAYEIPNYLRHDDVRVKKAALELYLISDKAGALQYLAGMLKAPTVKIRKNGLSLLATVDFVSAQNLVKEYLPFERDTDAKIQAGFILAANPTKESFKLLYECTHDKSGTLIPSFRDLWDAAVAGAIPLLAPDIATLMTILKSPFEQQLEQKADSAKQTAYSFKNITTSTKKNLYGEKDRLEIKAAFEEPDVQNFFEKFAAFCKHPQTVAGSVLLICVIVGVWWYSTVERHEERYRGNPDAKVVHETTMKMEENKGEAPSAVVGGKSSSKQYLGGKSYASAMRAMQAEHNSIALEFARKSEAALNDTFRQMALDSNYKGYAEFYLNENCKSGFDALQEGNYEEAKVYLLKSLDDPAVSNEAKILICQSLFGVGFETGDKAALEKAMDKFLSMIPESDIPKEYSRESMKNAFANMDKMRDITPQQFSQMLQKLSKQYPNNLSAQSQMQLIKGFEEMKQRFK